jgi:hypothetical protein
MVAWLGCRICQSVSQSASLIHITHHMDMDMDMDSAACTT